MLNREQINAICDAGKIIFCFDVDGTIFDMFTDAPNNSLISLINERFNNGHYIIIHTASSRRQRVTNMLKKHNVKYHEIVFGRPKAHIYIDDTTVDVNDYVKNPNQYETKYKEFGNRINDFMRKEK